MTQPEATCPRCGAPIVPGADCSCESETRAQPAPAKGSAAKRPGRPIPKRFGVYEVQRPLGAGGMGAVYLGRDPRLDRPVAIKVLQSAFPDDESLARFQREGQVLAKLDTPHVVHVYDVGIEGEHPYLVMEFVAGESLRELLKRRGGRIDLPESLPIVRGALEGLATVHRAGVLHRDLKPANLVLRASDGMVKIVDFGVAHAGKEAADLTRSGQAVGTPTYMAPEQWDGKELDARADIYALGVTWYHLLTGETPYVGETPAQILVNITLGQRTAVVEKRPDLPPAYAAVIERMSSIDREQRFASCEEVLDAIEAAGRGERRGPAPAARPAPRPTARRPSPARAAAAPARPSRGIVLAGGAAGLLAIAALAAVALSGGEEPASPPVEEAGPERPVVPADAPVPFEPVIRIAWPGEAPRALSRRELAVEGVLASTVPVSRLSVAGSDAVALEPGFSRWRARIATEERPDFRIVAVAEAAGREERRVVLWTGPVRWEAPVDPVAPDPDPERDPVEPPPDPVHPTDPDPRPAADPEEALEIRAIAWSPDGRCQAVGRYGGAVELRDVASGESRPLLPGSGEPILSLAFDASGRRLAAACRDGRVLLWNLAGDAALVASDRVHDKATSVAFSPDGTRLVSGGKRPGVRTWDAATGSPVREIRFDSRAVAAVAASPDGSGFACAIEEGGLSIWTWDGESARLEIPAVSGSTERLAWSPSTAVLATVGEDRLVHLWDAAEGRAIRHLEGHDDRVHGVWFHPGGRLAATASRDGSVRLWDVEAGKQVEKLGVDGVRAAAFGPEGRLLATAGEDGIRTWEVDVAHLLPEVAPPVPEEVFEHQGKRLTEGDLARLGLFGREGKVHERDALERAGLYGHRGRAYAPEELAAADWFLAEIGSIEASEKKIRVVAWSADGRFVASGSEDKTARLWEEGGTERAAIRHEGKVSALAVSADGSRFLAGDTDGEIRILDVATGRVVRTAADHEKPVRALAMSHDEKILATGDEDRNVLFWVPSTGAKVGSGLLELPGQPNALEFLPGSRPLLAVGMSNGTIRIVDVARGEGENLIGHAGSVRGLAVHPDGKSMASVDSTGEIRVWDLARGKLMKSIPTGRDLRAIEFSPDGRAVIVVHEEGTPSLRVIDLESGRDLKSVDVERPLAIAVHPEGLRLAVGDAEGDVNLLDLGELFRPARKGR